MFLRYETVIAFTMFTDRLRIFRTFFDTCFFVNTDVIITLTSIVALNIIIQIRAYTEVLLPNRTPRYNWVSIAVIDANRLNQCDIKVLNGCASVTILVKPQMRMHTEVLVAKT